MKFQNVLKIFEIVAVSNVARNFETSEHSKLSRISRAQ